MPELRQARALWGRNQLIEAVAIFDRVVKNHPANISALVDASRAFGSLYQYKRAEELLERALEVGAGSGKAQYLAGQSYRLMRRHTQAIECFQAAVGRNDDLSDAHLELAILYERHGDLDRAIDHCQARRRLHPLDAETRYLEGRILRRRQEFHQAEKILTQVAVRRKDHWLTRARCYAELGKLYDQQREYQQAWTAILRGKKLLLPHSGPFRRRRARMIPPLQDLADEVTEAQLSRWQNAAEPLPSEHPRPVLLTGMPRSGTTLLGQILGAHPEIVTADEFDLFPRILFPMLLEQTKPEDLSADFLDGMPLKKIESLRNSHHVLFGSALPDATAASLLIDKNPSLLPLVIPYYRLFPTDKLIVMLRDPRDVLVSCMMAYLPLNEFSVDFLAVETAVKRVESDLRSWLAVRDKLPQGSVIVIQYEKLVQDLRAETTAVLEHLGQEWSDQILDYASDANTKTVYSPSYVEVTQPVHTNATGRWEHYREQLEPHLQSMNNLAEQLGY